MPGRRTPSFVESGTQPGLPLKKGRAATMTHDYKRHGTTTLFAALDVKSGRVIGDRMPRHPLPGSGLPANHERGAKEFLKFLRQIDKTVPARPSVPTRVRHSTV